MIAFANFYLKDKKLCKYLAISVFIHSIIVLLLPSKLSQPYDETKDILLVKISNDYIKTFESDSNPQILKKISEPKKQITHQKSVQYKQSNNEGLSLPLEEPKYYSFQELDFRPTVVNDVNNNPQELSQYPEGGSVTLQLWMDEKGNISRVEVLKTNLTEDAAKKIAQGFLKLKFTPGQKNNEPVRSTVKITVELSSLLHK